jgi:hypothetical protein
VKNSRIHYQLQRLKMINNKISKSQNNKFLTKESLTRLLMDWRKPLKTRWSKRVMPRWNRAKWEEKMNMSLTRLKLRKVKIEWRRELGIVSVNYFIFVSIFLITLIAVNTSQLSKPQNGGTTAEEAESVTNVADNVKIANMKDTPQNKQLMNNSTS